MPYLQVDGSQIFYTSVGEGPCLVLVHGWTCDWVDWVWLMPLLQEHFRVIAYDRRVLDSTGKALDLRQQAADLAEIVTRLAGGRALLVGHSQGAVIASTAAVEHPELVAGVVALDAPYAAPDALRPILAEHGAILAKAAREGDDESARAFLRSMFGLRLGPERVPGWLRTLIFSRFDQLTAVEIHSDYAALWNSEDLGYRPAAADYLVRRKCPVLVLGTDQDRATYEEATFQHPASRAEVLTGTGHWMQIEQPDEVSRRILSWWATIR